MLSRFLSLLKTEKPTHTITVASDSELESGYVVVSTESPVAVTNSAEETLEEKIQRAQNLGPWDMPTNVTDQSNHYYSVMMHPLKSWQTSDEMESILHTASLEFPLLILLGSLSNEQAELEYSPDQIKYSLDHLKMYLITYMLRVDLAKKDYFIEVVIPVLNKYPVTNKEILLKYIKFSDSTTSNILWFWNEICNDPKLSEIIDNRLAVNTMMELMKLIEATVKTGNVLSEKEIQNFFMDKAFNNKNGKWENEEFANKLVKSTLLRQQNLLEKELLYYSRRNISLLSTEDKAVYHRGMPHIIAEANKKSTSAKFFAAHPSLRFLEPVNVFGKDLHYSLQAANIINLSHSMFKILFRDSQLPLSLYFPTLTLIFPFCVQLTAKYMNNWRDVDYNKTTYIVQRYKENLTVSSLNDRLPEWARLYQEEVNLRPNRELEANFLQRYAHNFANYMEYNKFRHMFFSLLTGIVLQSSLEAMAKVTKAESTMSGTVLYVMMLFLLDLVIRPNAVNYARYLDNGLRNSEERYKSHKISERKFSDMCEYISSQASGFSNVIISNTPFWKKPATVIQPKSTMKIEVIEGVTVENVVSAVRKKR